MEDDYEAFLQTLRPPWYEIKSIGRRVGLIFILFGTFSGLKTSPLIRGRWLTLVGSVAGVLSGFWLLFKSYWNDPVQLKEMHEIFLRSNFASQYKQYGWEQLLRVAGNEQTLTKKLTREILDGKMGFHRIWETYEEEEHLLSTVIMKYHLLESLFLLERFESDNSRNDDSVKDNKNDNIRPTTNVSAVQRLGTYGTFIHQELNVPKSRLKEILSSCPETREMCFSDYGANAHNLWVSGIFDTHLLREKCFLELREKGWVTFQSKTKWWLDSGLVKPNEVKVEFVQAFWQESSISRMVTTFWVWPLSKFSQLLAPPVYTAVKDLALLYLKTKSTRTQQKSELEQDYEKTTREVKEDANSRKKEQERQFQNITSKILQIHKDDDTTAYLELRQETLQHNSSISSIETSCQKDLKKAEQKYKDYLATLDHNYKIIENQLNGVWMCLKNSNGENTFYQPIDLTLLNYHNKIVLVQQHPF
eukprot:TRINITY_DN5688_c1_g2_i2.p1 TRINITY_DN5688_c1_g2~~TRINITY_DN5688_c1_g2_i2.p1  ORF type:complete len:488 (+),score=110.61 TRINITY_DN5688_c1_g2_i2:41-1465(+)